MSNVLQFDAGRAFRSANVPQNLDIPDTPVGDEAIAQIVQASCKKMEIEADGSPSSASQPNVLHFLQILCRKLISAGKVPPHVELVCRPTILCRISPDRLMSVGVIVAHVLHNALADAGPGRAFGYIAISCDQEPDGSLCLEISDDGFGLPPRFNLLGQQSADWKMIERIADAIPARIENSSVGLNFIMRISG